MRRQTSQWKELTVQREDREGLRLRNGSRVAVLGGGPAGSLFSYFLLEMAQRIGLDITVDLFEPRDFSRPAPHGCNMCGGIISESLVQHLAAEGIRLPANVVQRGIDSYQLHTDQGNVRIEPPLHEMRIGSVYRGAGPRDIKDSRWESFDGYLQTLAVEKGARPVRTRVMALELDEGRPRLEGQSYDLLAVATGINAGSLKLLEGLGFGYTAPPSAKTFIREYQLGEEGVAESVGNSMHVFLLNLPRVEFAAISPKGDYASVCLLGKEIDNEIAGAFLDGPEARGCFPPDWELERRSCQCSPRISIGGAAKPYTDRIVFVGDCAETRLYKDGIGAAYRTAKVAARTAVFEGISAACFEEHYEPILRSIRKDNRLGKWIFALTRIVQKRPFAQRAILRMTASEQSKAGKKRRLSSILWDLFTGSASYRSVVLRAMHPLFILGFLGHLGRALLPFGRTK